MNYYEIGQQIRKFRKARGFSQEQLAEMVDISVTHMSHIETGNTKLSLPVFVAISNALNVRADDLLNMNDKSFTTSNAIDDIVLVISSCSSQEAKIIVDVVKSLKISLGQNF